MAQVVGLGLGNILHSGLKFESLDANNFKFPCPISEKLMIYLIHVMGTHYIVYGNPAM